MIPEAKTAAVARALRETFGVGEFDEVRILTAGPGSKGTVNWQTGDGIRQPEAAGRLKRV